MLETPEQILDATCVRLAEALTAREVTWTAVGDDNDDENAKRRPVAHCCFSPINPERRDD